MAYTFTIVADGSLDDLLARARAEIEARGGTLEGGAEEGEFRIPTPVGRIQGGYRAQGREVEFTIRRRPMMISRDQIESKLREALEQA